MFSIEHTMDLVDSIKQSIEYRLIARHLGHRTVEGGQGLLLDQVTAGLTVLAARGASGAVLRAYCVHPLFQRDADLLANRSDLSYFDATVTCFAMEFRHIANGYQRPPYDRRIVSIDEIALSPLDDVNEMLIAEKLAVYRDFVRFGLRHHGGSWEIEQWFENWFERLGIHREVSAEIRVTGELPARDRLARRTTSPAMRARR